MKQKLLSCYFFLVFLFTAQPCNIFDVTDVGSPLSIALMGAFSLLMCIIFKVRLLSGKLIAILLLMAFWGLLQKILLGRVPSPLIYFELFLAYVVYSLYKESLFSRFEQLSVKMSILAVVLWCICLVSYHPMFALAQAIGDKGAGVSQSLYVFSIPKNINNVGFLLRNCGYSWEPGRFASMLIVALWFNILRTNLNFKDKNFIILTIALITSQSTTGYVIYILMVGVYYVVNKHWNPIILVIGGALVAGSMTLPFMQQKIISLFDSSQNMEDSFHSMDYLAETGASEGLYIPQRFDGFVFQSMNLEKANKLIGDGRNYQNFYLNKTLNYPIVVSEGILAVFIKYGWILAILMYYSLFRSSSCFSAYFNNKGKLLYPILFIGLNFSYYLWAAPILMTLWLWAFWEGKLVVKHKKSYNL